MGYAIVAGVGLLLGLGLTIFLLRERNKRYTTQHALATKTVALNRTLATLDSAQKRAVELHTVIQNLRAEVARHQNLLQKIASKSKDPTAVKAWIDAVLSEGEK